jgi:hypothetical protein
MVVPTLHRRSELMPEVVGIFPLPLEPEWRRLVAWILDACELWFVMPLIGALVGAMVVQHC